MSATKVRCLCGVGGCDVWDGMQHEKFDNDVTYPVQLVANGENQFDTNLNGISLVELTPAQIDKIRKVIIKEIK